MFGELSISTQPGRKLPAQSLQPQLTLFDPAQLSTPRRRYLSLVINTMNEYEERHQELGSYDRPGCRVLERRHLMSGVILLQLQAIEIS
jgi:hypothetical protein